MDSRSALKAGIASGNMITQSYLGDLTDADLLVRPADGTNHIAWQLGHLIQSEHQMMSLLRPGSMPELPAGFAAKYSKETAKSDNPKDFLTKDQYLQLANAQREGTLTLLATMSDADLDQPAPEPLRHFLHTVGDVFSMQGTHWVMHAGQWAIIRRKLGRPPLF